MVNGQYEQNSKMWYSTTVDLKPYWLKLTNYSRLLGVKNIYLFYSSDVL